MNARRVRFGVALAAFVAWLCWLGYLVAHQSREEIVSRPQILAANYLIVAHLEAGPDGKPEVAVKVQQVLPGGEPGGPDVKMLLIDGLDGAAGFHGAGDYLLPVSKDRRDQDDGLRITRIPQSPGFDPYHVRNRTPIYAWSPGVEAQVRGIRPP